MQSACFSSTKPLIKCQSGKVSRVTPAKAKQSNSFKISKEHLFQGFAALTTSILLGNAPVLAAEIYTPGQTLQLDQSKDLMEKLKNLPKLTEYPGENSPLKEVSPSGMAVEQEKQSFKQGNKFMDAVPQNKEESSGFSFSLPNPFAGGNQPKVAQTDESQEEKQAKAESPESIAREREYRPEDGTSPKSSGYVV